MDGLSNLYAFLRFCSLIIRENPPFDTTFLKKYLSLI
jgi:hypothetical protein